MIEFDEIDENRLFSDYKNMLILKIGASWCKACKLEQFVTKYKNLENELNQFIDFCEIDVNNIDDEFTDIYKHGDKFPNYKLISKNTQSIENFKSLISQINSTTIITEKPENNNFYYVLKEYDNQNLDELRQDINKIHNINNKLLLNN